MFFPDDETDAVATGAGADVGVLEMLIPWLCDPVDVCVGVTVEEADTDGDDELEGVGVWLLLADGESVPVGVSEPDRSAPALVGVTVPVPVGVTVPVGEADVFMPTEVGVGEAVILPRR
jgi:hypothetical protein